MVSNSIYVKSNRTLFPSKSIFENIGFRLPSITKCLPAVYIFFTLFVSLPFAFNSAIGGVSYKGVMIIGNLLSFVLYFLIFIFRGHKVALQKNILFLYSIQIMALLLLSVFHIDYKYLEQVGLVLVSLMMLSVVDKNNMGGIASVLLKTAALFSIFATIAFVLVLLGILPQIDTFPNPDGRIASNFILTFSNVKFPIGKGFVIRPASYFDEPGQFALFLTYCLIINHLTFKNKLWEYAYIIGGIITTSMAFYLVFPFYLFFIKKKVRLTLFLLLLVVMSIFYVEANRSNPIVKRIAYLTVDRIINQAIEGDITKDSNRANQFQNAIFYANSYPILGVGLTNSLSGEIPPIRNNFFAPFAINGYCLGLFTLAPLISVLILLSARIKSQKGALGILMIIGMNFAQRPSVVNILYLFLYGIIIMILDQKSQTPCREMNN